MAAPARAPEAAPVRERESELVTLFLATEVCGELEPREVAMRGASPAEAVRAVVRAPSLAHLPLAPPDVRVEESSARVDLALLPRAAEGAGSSRHSLRALSTCEQHALLDAISLTLRANVRWGIRQVLFTERGNLLAI